MQDNSQGPDEQKGSSSDASTQALAKLANMVDTMLRRDLRWRNFRALLIGGGLIVSATIYSLGLKALVAPTSINEPYVSLVRLQGTIDSGQPANAHKMNAALQSAFEDQQSKGVVLLVDSPGGSPVQSSLIYERIKTLRAKHPDKKMWAVGEDYMTSGAYFISVASNNICVNRSTLTGSVGVIMQGWGLDKVLDKYNVERRVFTAGNNKDRMDMWKPMTDADKKKAATLLDHMHAHFIEAVESTRKDRLVGPKEHLFSGDFWTGDEALKLGLVDKLCDLESILSDEYHVNKYKDYTVPPSLLAKLTNQFGASISQAITTETVARPMFLPN